MSTKLAIRELYFNPCCRVLPGCRGAAGVLPGCCRVPRVYLHHATTRTWHVLPAGHAALGRCRAAELPGTAGYCRVAGAVPGRCRVGAGSGCRVRLSGCRASGPGLNDAVGFRFTVWSRDINLQYTESPRLCVTVCLSDVSRTNIISTNTL
jgi:hypothetical protein